MKTITSAAGQISATVMMVISALILFTLTGCDNPKVYKIGIVNAVPAHEAIVAGFKSGLAKSGFIDGKNITYQYSETIPSEQIDAVLHDLVRKNVDLIFVVTTPVARKAKEIVMGTKIPVVFAPVLYPVESGLVESLIHPGGNFTGIQAGGSIAKALEWHKAAVPGSKNLFVPYKFGDEVAEQSLAELKDANELLDVKLVLREVRSQRELEAALDNIPREADSIWLLNSSFLISNVDLFVKSAIKHKLPLSSGTSQYRAGALVTYGQKPFSTGEQAARLAQRILDGVPPSELPVEISEFYLGVNLRTARAIGISISDSILLQADDIAR